MSEADGNLTILKKPVIYAKWTAEVPSVQYLETFSIKFYMKSVECQFRLMVMINSLYLDLISNEFYDVDECFRCTVVVSGLDLELPPLPVRKYIEQEDEYFCLWKMDMSDLELARILGKTLSFLVVLEEDEGSTQKQEDEKSVQTPFRIDPIPCSESLSEDWAKFLDADTNTDVDFQCDGQSTKAHRLVVSARSPVLATMLQSQMVEGTTGIVRIEDMDLDSLRLFVRYLYTGRLDEAPTFETAVALYEAGDKYGVQSLARRCTQSLIEGLTVENACDVLDIADRHSDDKFVEEIIIFILENKVPSISKHWRAFCRNHPLLANEVMLRYIEELSFAS